MKLVEFLDKSGTNYEVTEHEAAFTAQSMARAEHEPGRYVAKPVIVKADDEYLMCVLAACYKIDLLALKNQLGAASVDLAEESDIGRLFPDCELGAEPPFGNLYGLTTIMDKNLAEDGHIMFQAGTHKQAIQIGMDDYKKLVEPKVLAFSYRG